MNRLVAAVAILAVLSGCAVAMRYPWDKQQDTHSVKPTPLPTPTADPTAYPTPSPAATPQPPVYEPLPETTPAQVLAPTRAPDCVVMFPTGDAKAIPCPATPTPTPEVIQ